MAEGPTVLLVASSVESNITVWDVSTGTALTSFKSNACPPNGLSLLGRDYLVAAQAARGGSLHFWAWHKDQPHQRCFAAEQLTAVAATRDGVYCAAGGASGAVFVWETSSGRLLRTWPAHYKAVTCLAFSDSGAVLVTGGEDTLVNAWLLADVLDATAGQQLQMGGPLLQPLASWSDHTLPVSCLAVGAGDAGAIVVSGSHDRTVKVRSLAGGSGGLLRSVALPSPVHSLALDPGEHALYAGCASGSIYEVALVGGPAADAAADSSGGLEGAAAAAAAAAGGGGAYPALEGHSTMVSCLGFTPDAAYLISGSADHSVRVWELRSRQQVRLLPNPVKGPVSALLALPQPPFMQVGGSHAASSSGNGGGKRGPKRPQPLAPFCKYPNAPGTLKPWEGGLVLLDGSAGAADAATDGDVLQRLAATDGSVWQAAGAAVPAAGQSAAEDEWRVANGSRRHRKAERGGASASGPRHGVVAPAASRSSSSQPPSERQVQQRSATVDAAAHEVAAAPLWRHLSQQLGMLPPHCALPAIRRMVIYGLGSLEQPGAVHIRYQLALATLLAAALPAAAAPPVAFDPVFTQLDRTVLAHFGIEVLAHDEGGRHVAEQPTLFWMPHCEAVLTDALLAANVAAGTLHNCRSCG
ncbi:ROOT INITIATION DEFECTIVE 3 [Chlorella sorokiniana]|uniref:ROOT INITIATION DEFECTIVE 3 n=1 Tax=Chlorella sorokiniana TaxID=3076 RepID=A0A2P6THY0_CHLSO|nr:ROOT INITIATION DEFECTIVE 3 [Chlorella sorokiniana]|eukprot:PRW33905.1 ROOT INITIATION DEFECTIVE 3 [Chlorella sorokiniana]